MYPESNAFLLKKKEKLLKEPIIHSVLRRAQTFINRYSDNNVLVRHVIGMLCHQPLSRVMNRNSLFTTESAAYALKLHILMFSRPLSSLPRLFIRL